MDKLVKITLFLTALSSSVFSSPNELIYKKVISSGENIVYVEPILDINNELSGFVYTDSAENKLVIDKFESESSIIIDVPESPLFTIVRHSELRDTLYIYTLTMKLLGKPQITLTTYYNKTYSQQTITAYASDIISYSMYVTYSYEEFNLKFYPNNRNPQQVLINFSYRINDYIFSIGSTSYNVSTSLAYNLDLSELMVSSPQTNLYPSYLFSSESKNYVYLDKYYDSYDYSNPSDPDNYGLTSYQKLEIFDNFENLNSQLMTSYDSIYSIHVDNFAPSSPTDELIIHANSADLLEYYDIDNHIACYSFANGTPTELWYNNNITGIDFSFVYHNKDLLVGVRDLQEIVMLNYLNGQISDSSLLDSKLSHIQFFESGLEQPLLNLVGMSGDTVKTYRFDIATNITEPSLQEELPQTFSLFQNHPNPFNGETRLEFTTTENQYLKLSVFNILGQEI
ncbi:MAG TPA: hypothetical protein ENH23_00515, partial [candidate division Zixibacteria bacterium]|nr:hypothetical protein [candidate division Zixibacteria bacterium]